MDHDKITNLMYSGITQGLFPIVQIEKKPNILIYTVRLNANLVQGLQLGASVNIDGACQTVTKIENNDVSFAAMTETLKLTTLNTLELHQKVSIERSLKLGEEIGGHLIAGHVIGTGLIEEVFKSENNLSLLIQCRKEWMKYIFSKGFIAVDGSSLTIGEVKASSFYIHLIPETLRLTNFGNKKIGDQVNIELDHQTKIIVDTVTQYLEHHRIFP